MMMPLAPGSQLSALNCPRAGRNPRWLCRVSSFGPQWATLGHTINLLADF